MIWERIFEEFLEFRAAKTVLLYFPLANEISLIPIFDYAREIGIGCAFPRCKDRKGEMDFYYVDSLDDLTVGTYGIREPEQGTQKVTDCSGAIAFVPALAYDREGYRIGYGGGYYDRFLATHRVFSVGVAYEEFLTPSLPHGLYDRAVNAIVTEKDIYRI